MKRILFIEDDSSYRALLKNQLEEAGFEVDDFENPIKGLEALASKHYQMVISDLMLPVMSGVMFTESVKNINPDTLCIILTGEPDEESEVKAIRNNVDLYLEKTRRFPVILEYINKLFEESKTYKPREINLYSNAENLVLDVGNHTVMKDQELLDLTPIEFEILKLLLQNKNQVISREDFIDLIWAESSDEVSPRIVDSHIKRLRTKIKSFSLMTVRGYGYKWNEVEA